MVAWLAIQAGISAGFLVGDYIYHRLEKKPLVKIKFQEVSIPRVDDGAPVPLIYGRCRVRAPILAWHGAPQRSDGIGAPGADWPVGTTRYHMDMFLVLGLGVAGTQGTSRIHKMWAGEKAFSTVGGWPDPEITFQIEVNMTSGIEPGYIGGRAFWYNGGPFQYFAASDGGSFMIGNGVSESNLPSYRGMLSVLLYDEVYPWLLGASPSMPAYSFEASSYAPSNYPWGMQIGPDCNPIDVLYDILTCQFGKLGIPSSYIDMSSFVDAAGTLVGESHGYSRCFEDRREAKEIIAEILRQIDGVLFFDETTAKFKIKLVRSYDPATIPQLTKDNCDPEGSSFDSGGWSNLINKVRVVYTNRDDDYRDGSETARNHANAVGQDGVVIEEVIEFRGVTHAALAYALAHRELAYLSRPMIKGHVVVDRSFVRVNPGDAIRVYWSDPDISGIVFRVASVSRGTLENGRIRLDLIQDANYVFRGRIPEPPAFVDTGDLGGGIVGGPT